MIKIKVTTPNPLIPLARQTPGSKGVWEDCQFFLDTAVEQTEWWFVMDGLQKAETAQVPKEHTVLVTSESEDMKTYDQKYLDQFGVIVTSQRKIKHPRVIYTAQGQAWMVGHMGGRSGVDPKDYHKYFIPYDKLKEITAFKKEKLISVFSSGKSRTPGQQLRLDFIETLKKHFGDRIDVFGVYERYVHDKWDGIAPYKYHISLENSHRDDYWTEKLADAFLGGAYPLYFGAPNIYSYFPTDSITQIDLSNFDTAIKTIEQTISDNTYEKRIDAIMTARTLVLDKHNIFAIISRIAHEHAHDVLPATAVTIYPEQKKETLPQRMVRILKNTGPLYTVARYAFRKYRSQ